MPIGDCHEEFTLSYTRFFAALRMTKGEGLAMTGGKGSQLQAETAKASIFGVAVLR